MKAWHFLPRDRQLRYGARELVQVGQTYTAEAPLMMCERGLHASIKPLDALSYAPGPVVCRVELGGKILRDSDKVCAETRTVLWMADATMVLHEFACECAVRCMEKTGWTDHRSWAAVDAKLAWMGGHISDSDLAAASAAARAASAAARAASAAAGAVAAGAAWDAARAARDAAKAARDAAWDAARAARAASDAALAAETRAQNARLEVKLMELKP